MTRNPSLRPRRPVSPGRWALQDAKARFSEVVKRAKSEGPQRVTVHNREEVVVLSIEEFRRLKGEPTGQVLIDTLRESPVRDLEFRRRHTRAPVRGIDL